LDAQKQRQSPPVVVLTESEMQLEALRDAGIEAHASMLRIDSEKVPQLHAFLDRQQPTVAVFLGYARSGAKDRLKKGTVIAPTELHLRFPPANPVNKDFAVRIAMSGRLRELTRDLPVQSMIVQAGDAGLKGLPPLDVTASPACFVFGTAMRRRPTVESLIFVEIDDAETRRSAASVKLFLKILPQLAVAQPATSNAAE
jgi:hypothetical protein